MAKKRMRKTTANNCNLVVKKTSIPAPNKPIAKEIMAPNRMSLIGLRINTRPRIPKHAMVVRSKAVYCSIKFETVAKRYNPAPMVINAMIPIRNPTMDSLSIIFDMSSALTPASRTNNHDAANNPPIMRMRKFQLTRVSDTRFKRSRAILI